MTREHFDGRGRALVKFDASMHETRLQDAEADTGSGARYADPRNIMAHCPDTGRFTHGAAIVKPLSESGSRPFFSALIWQGVWCSWPCLDLLPDLGDAVWGAAYRGGCWSLPERPQGTIRP